MFLSSFSSSHTCFQYSTEVMQSSPSLCPLDVVTDDLRVSGGGWFP